MIKIKKLKYVRKLIKTPMKAKKKINKQSS